MDNSQRPSSDDPLPQGEPMTQAQRIYAENLTAQNGQPPLPDNLTRDEAEEEIEALRSQGETISDTNDIDIEDDPDLGGEEE